VTRETWPGTLGDVPVPRTQAGVPGAARTVGPSPQQSSDDLTIALVVAAVWWLDLVVVGVADVPQPLATIGVVVTCLPLALRRSQPLLVAAAVFASLMLQAAAGIDPDVSILPGVAVGVAMYTLGADRSDERALTGLLFGLFAGCALVLSTPGYGAGDFLLFGAPIVAPFLAGRVVERFVLEDVDPTTAPVATDRTDDVPLSVSQERTAIAQDVHGLLRAEVVDGMADPARGEAAARTLDRLVDLLGGDLHPPGTRPPSVVDVPDLVTGAARHGADLRLVLRDGGRAVRDPAALRLPDDVSLAVFRILEDAIDNVVDHAAPCGGTVAISRLDDHVEVEVLDEGAPLPDPVRGHGGLLAMRERAVAHGGTLYAARRDAGGVRIRVRMPLPQSVPDEDEPASDDEDPGDAVVLTDPTPSTATTLPTPN